MSFRSLRRQFMQLAVRGAPDVFDPDRRIEHIPYRWRGITMQIIYTPDAHGPRTSVYHFSRLEVQTERRLPLPITDTGYKSQSQPGGTIEAAGGPVAYVERWLDEAAKSGAWRAIEAELRQGSLF